MTLAICTHTTDGMQDGTTDALEEAFSQTGCRHGVPAVLPRLFRFSAICRTFISGGARIRTGDTMIFSHMQKPIGMRKTRIGKRIYVHRVPVGTIWSCPYCCATVDTPFVTPTAQILVAYR
jgi:hypothetical protein